MFLFVYCYHAIVMPTADEIINYGKLMNIDKSPLQQFYSAVFVLLLKIRELEKKPSPTLVFWQKLHSLK